MHKAAIVGIAVACVIVVALAIALPLALHKKTHGGSQGGGGGSSTPTPTPEPAPVVKRHFQEVWWIPGVGDSPAMFSNSFRWDLTGLTCAVANVVIMAPCPAVAPSSSIPAQGCLTNQACGAYPAKSSPPGLIPLQQWQAFKSAFSNRAVTFRVWLRFHSNTGDLTKQPSYQDQWAALDSCYPTQIPTPYGAVLTKQESQVEGTKSDGPSINSFWGLVAAKGCKAAVIGSYTDMVQSSTSQTPYSFGLGELYEPFIIGSGCCPDQSLPPTKGQSCGPNAYATGFNNFLASTSGGIYLAAASEVGGTGVALIGAATTGVGTDCGLSPSNLLGFIAAVDPTIQRLGLWL